MQTVRDGDLEIVMAGPTGYGNNVYVVIDRSTNEAAFIDAPGEPDVNAQAAEGAGVQPSKILLTHGHFDHTPAIDALKERFGAKLYAVHRDDDGRLHSFSARCPHLGCIVGWNGADRAWECPCHGSRFAADGSLVQGPATADLPAEELP